MSATMSDSVVISISESQSTPVIKIPEVEFAKCDICGLIEECTPAYIGGIRERYQGRWICGLCAEAVKDEIFRSEISIEEAMDRHLKFCESFRSSTPPRNSMEQMIAAIKHLLRKSLDSPRTRSTPTSPLRKQDGGRPQRLLTRSESCFPTLSLELIEE